MQNTVKQRNFGYDPFTYNLSYKVWIAPANSTAECTGDGFICAYNSCNASGSQWLVILLV